MDHKNDNNFMLEQLYEGIKATSNLFHTLNNDVRANHALIIEISSRIKNLEKDIVVLRSTVTDGNGKTPLVLQVQDISYKLDEVRKKNEELKGTIELLNKKEEEVRQNRHKIDEEKKTIDRKAKWQLIIIMAAIIISFLASFGTFIINWKFGNYFTPPPVEMKQPDSDIKFPKFSP